MPLAVPWPIFMPHTLDRIPSIAIFCLTLMTGVEFAVSAFIHPTLARLTPRTHAEAAAAIARVLGKAMPPWYALSLILTGLAGWHLRRLSGEWNIYIIAATVILAATILSTILVLVPINNRIAALDPGAPYPTWLSDRQRWDNFHRVRVAALLVATTCLLLGQQ